MFTRPSISDLLEGAMNTVERVLLPAVDGRPEADVIAGLLLALERVQAEGSGSAHFLAADTRDVQHTLLHVAAVTGRDASGVSEPSGASGAEQGLTTHQLAEQNRASKRALVAMIDALDLPADPHDPPTLRHADLEVRQLLARMLYRERDAHPTTPRRARPFSRGAAAIDPAELDRIACALRRFVAHEMPEASDVLVTNLRPVAGGSSRESFAFDATWTAGGEPHAESCVLQRQPVSSVLECDESEGSISGTRRLPKVEFEMVQLMEAQGIPVPRPLWVEPTGTWLDRPFAVSRWVHGDADLYRLADAPNLDRILEQYLDILVRLHSIDPDAAGVDLLGRPSVATAAIEQIELFDRAFEKQRLEEFPAITYLVRWLRKHQPVASRVSVVHGDYRLGNVMWDDDGVVAVLDWEQCHLGDPLEEIAFMYWPAWTLERFIPIGEFVRRYENASGVAVDRDALAFYRVFIELKMCVVVLTGINSFFATSNRQLRYGANTGYEYARECQLRVIEELLHGGPTFEFRSGAAPEPAS